MKNDPAEKGLFYFGDRLFNKIREKETVLCLGLDPHLDLIPEVFQHKHKVNKIIYNKDNIKIVERFCNSILDNCIDSTNKNIMPN